MSKFVDVKGDEWRVKVTLPLLKRVRSDLDIDLGKPTEFIALAENPIDACDVIYVLCRKQCERRNLTDEDFGSRLAGDVLEDAWKALEKAYLDFCPDRQRKALQSLVVASQGTEQAAMEVIERRLNDLTDSFSSATNLEESPELTPIHSRSEN